MLARLRHRFLRRPVRSLHASASACNSSCTPYDANSEPCEEEVVHTYPDYPLAQPVTSSGIRLLTENTRPNLHPPQMKNKGNYFASLSRVAAWLGGIAEVAQFLLFPSPDAEDAQGGRKEAQTYEFEIKEVWRIEEGRYVPGEVHTLGRAHQGWQLGILYITWPTAPSA
ncbi:hypothetical protein K438DRAFT_1993341 [Mycena galopus ATCC 62051]|nr:hypothetical protein K438DRAFT_1993341 [Mycena galopus ATCC 62051]